MGATAGGPPEADDAVGSAKEDEWGGLDAETGSTSTDEGIAP